MARASLIKRGDRSLACCNPASWPQARAEEIERAVLDALEAGYRHFDTAFNYGNERDIGRALRSWLDAGRGKREELFIVTKVGQRSLTTSKAYEEFSSYHKQIPEITKK